MYKSPTMLTKDYYEPEIDYHYGMVHLLNKKRSKIVSENLLNSFNRRPSYENTHVIETAPSEVPTNFEPPEYTDSVAPSLVGDDDQSKIIDYKSECSICMNKYGDMMEHSLTKKKVKCEKVDVHIAINGEAHVSCRSCIDKWSVSNGNIGSSKCPFCNELVVHPGLFPTLRNT